MKRLLSLVLILTIALSSCKNDDLVEVVEIDPAFTGYIAAFTSGVISNSSSIVIKLREPVAGAVEGEEVNKSLFDFSPDIDGKAYWTSNKSISFKPDKNLPSDKLFQGEFALSKLMEVPDKLETFVFQFQTMKQYISVNFEGLSAYDNKNLKWQKMNGVLFTADFASEEEVEKTLKVTQNGERMGIKWEHAADGRRHQFHVDSLIRDKKTSQVILEWNGEPIGTEVNNEEVIEIPPIDEFKVLDIQVTQQPEQFITLYFSDPIDEEQELKGLIYLNAGGSLRYNIQGSKVKVYPTSRITNEVELNVNIGVRNSMNYKLKEAFSKTVKFSNLKPNVELIGSGVILPSTNGLIFPFKAVNLNAVNVKVIKIFEDNIGQFLQVNRLDGTRELKRVGRIVYKNEVPLKANKAIDQGSWNTFSLDLSQLINTEPGAVYRVTISFTQNQSLYPCEDAEVDETMEIDNLLGEDPELARFDDPENYYYDDYYYNYNDDYRYQDRDNPCKKSYYLRNQRAVSRNVLASDLGVIAKGSTGKELFVAVTDLKTTESLSGVNIDILNLQSQVIATGTTDGDGMAKIKLGNKPFLLVAKQGNQRGYLRLDDGSALSLSMFDVGGSEVKKGLKGFIYGERGVWRPGDSLFVSFILEDKSKVVPKNHPIVFELFTPENQLFDRIVKSDAVNGFYDFRTATNQDSPTGNWLAKVNVGGATFTKTLKVETVKPNRLKIKLEFDEEVLQSGKTANGNLQVNWLHGAIAKNLKADVEVTLAAGKSNFDKHKDYSFSDPLKYFDGQDQIIFDGKVNDSGQATVNASFDVDDNAPGMLTANFKIRAFEEGGEFSVDRFSIPYSPYTGYVGVKIPEGKGWNNALYSNEANQIPIVTVDEMGQPVNRQKLKIEIYSIGWRWWWQRSEQEDLASYIRNQSSSLLKTDYVNTTNGKVIYEMNLGSRSWGRKLIRITDPVTGHSTGQIFYTSYRGWWSDGQKGPGGAEMLTFKTDKETYTVGEKVTVTLPANEKGKALVSIESGSNIVDAFWVKSDKETAAFDFEVTESMAPNVYIHISYIQPHHVTENDLPIRLYGVQSISVENPGTHLSPQISMPDVLEPEKDFTVKVSEKQGKAMTYTVAVVDEGLLDLTRFVTPDAWNYFYSREALGVKTWDMYQYVVGAFSGEMSGLLALGGDMELQTQDEVKKANRFKPVVMYAGPFTLKAGKTANHTFKMPNYVGSVKTMIVAGQDGAYGKTDKATPVKKPLMVLATMPRVIGPAESAKLPVTVFAMDQKVKDVTVKLEVNDMLKVSGNSTQKLRFNEEGDQVVYFDVEALKKVGVGKVKVIATSGNEKATHEIELDVRIANPPITKVIDAVVEPGEKWSTSYLPIGVEGTNGGALEVSGIPPLNLESRLEYLIRYPHGCVEQTTSAIFPQLHLSKLMDLTAAQKSETESNIKAAILKLKDFQNTEGGLSYWPGEHSYYSEWGTNYAGHFMLEAEAAGYSLPLNFKQKWINFQQQRANNWDNVNRGPYEYYSQSHQLVQAYRLYTLALAKKPALGAMNRMRELSNLSNTARWRLAAAYQLAGRENVAKELVKSATTTVKDYTELSYSYGSSMRDQAMILETLVLMNDKANAKSVLDELVNKMASERWYSTQTVAYTLLAVSKFVGTSPNSGHLKYEYQFSQFNKETTSSEAPIVQHKIPYPSLDEQEVTLTNTSQKTMFVRLILSGTPLEGKNLNAENDLQMSVTYHDLQGKAIDITKLEQGTDFMAEVTVKHPGFRLDYKEMALTQIFPSGWEIRNLRMDWASAISTGDEPRYQDIRDDRVYTYFDLDKGKSKTFRVLLNAAYLGNYYLPTVHCGAMYDEAISAYKAGKWVDVVKAGDTQ